MASMVPAMDGAQRRHWARWVLAFAALALGGGLLARHAIGPVVDVVAVQRADLVQHVVVSGRVAAPARVALAAAAPGRVTAVTVDAGDRVAAGQVVVEIDDAQARAELDRALAAEARADARLDRLRRVGSPVAGQEARQALARRALAETELARIDALVKGGALPPQALEQARSTAEVARSQAESAALRSAATQGSETREAAAALAQARAAVEVARTDLADRRVAAPAAGTILERDVEPGDVVAAGRTLLVLARAGATRLEAEPEEGDLALLHPGQPATASADAYPDTVFAAVVSWIAPAVDARRGTIAVRLRVPDPPGVLRPEMTVSIQIEVARRAGALVVPADAVRDLAEARPWVIAVRDGRARRQAVVLGITGDDAVEIARGLRVGDLVVLPGADVADGRRVRTRIR